MYDYVYMGVSKNRGTPKWMVDSGKPYLLMDDLGGPPLFLETPICTLLMCTIANYFIIKSNELPMALPFHKIWPDPGP